MALALAHKTLHVTTLRPQAASSEDLKTISLHFSQSASRQRAKHSLKECIVPGQGAGSWALRLHDLATS